MGRKYSDKERNFIKNICKGKTTYEIVELFNRQFNSNITRSQIRSYMKNHKIKSAIERNTIAKMFIPKLLTDEQHKFIEINAKGVSNEELTEKFNDYFKLNLKVSQIKAFKSRNHIDSGLTGHFKKGSIPYNKGIKGICPEGCKKTWFKKGNKPKNYMPVGTERINGDGYVDVKVADPNKWRGKHIIVWEEHNGPVPEEHAVIFGDGNRKNFDSNNLILVSRQQLLVLNRYKLIQNDAELTRTGVIIADLHQKISERKSEAK